MRKLLKQYALVLWLSLILIAGFGSTAAVGYLAARDAIQQGTAEQALPLTGDFVYSAIQKDLLRPLIVSAQMAQDSFVRDWLLNGELDQEQIVKYLREVRQKTNAVSSYLVSDLSRNYYYANGILKTVSETDPRDQWYYRVRQIKSAYETKADLDQANRDNLTIFVNYRIQDYEGKFIGVTGIGFTVDTLKRLIDSYQQRFHRGISFVDSKGGVILSGNGRLKVADNIQALPGLKALAATILANKKSESLHLEYKTETDDVLVDARYLPELGWHLLVEQESGGDLKPVQDVFWLNLAIGGAITLATSILLLTSVRRYLRRIEQSAATDALTTLLNRQAFDFVFQQALLDTERSRQPLCVVLVDIDFFKKINDKQGHLIGDHVLREIAMIAKRSLRESDVICRWGGEEFLILLKNCTLEKATSIAETLRGTIAANDFSRTTSLAKTRLAVTVSMGVAQCKDNESEDSVFERAEVALHQAKENGRNSVYFSE